MLILSEIYWGAQGKTNINISFPFNPPDTRKGTLVGCNFV